MITTEMTAPGLVRISDDEFSDITRLVHDRFGISLGEKKKALVRGRLNSHLRKQGFATFGDFYRSVCDDDSGQGLLTLVDRLSTNHSYFFRESDHFDHLVTEAVTSLDGAIGAQFRIWSAGCAAGEEAYTLAMVLSEFAAEHRPRWKPAILATDISMGALLQAQGATYGESRVATVPERYRKYFKRNGDGQFEVLDSIRNMVLFRRLNLMRPDYPFSNQFQVVFCRNVMIYFDHVTKTELSARFSRYVQPGGYLYIGHSETLGRSPAGWQYVRPTVYQRCEG